MITIKRKFLLLRVFYSAINLGLIFLLILPSSCFSQKTDTIDLHEISVSPRYATHFHKKNALRVIDSIFIQSQAASSMAQVLQNDNSLYVKSYGPSGSAVSSIRGGNSAQTAVLWNGFSIRNPMLGETDLSLFSVFLTDEILIERGGSTAVWGNASVAGSIHLRNSPGFNQGMGVSVFCTLASFGQQSAGVKVSFGNKRWYSSTRCVYNSAENDFNYVNAEGQRLRMKNSAFTRKAVLQENAFLLKKNQVLTFRIWLQGQTREIPSANLIEGKKSTQDDEIFRSSLEYAIQSKKLKTLLRQAFLLDKLVYADGFSFQTTYSKATTLITEAEFDCKANENLTLQGGLNNTYCTALSDAYSTQVFQNYFSVFASFFLSSKKSNNQLRFRSRLEHTLSSVQPFTFSAEYRRKLFSGLDLVMGGNKLYRLPSMNDLYWNPGGNRSLLPEHGYSEEMNLVFQNDSLNKLKTIRVTFSAAVFSRQMRNWIIWLPGASGIWTPQNLLEVWSRGTETTTQFVYHKNEIQMKVQLSTQYVLSTSQKKHSSSDQSEGNQLVYVPMYSGNATFQIKYKLLYLAYTHNYTGYRYTTSDNYYYLMPFNLANLIFGKKVIKGKMIYDFNFTSNNIFNISYQAIAGRPMPGRNYQFSINLSYKAKT